MLLLTFSERDSEYGLSFTRSHIDTSAVFPENVRHYRKTETVSRGFLGSEAFLKDLIPVLLGYPRSVVGDLKQVLRGSFVNIDPDLLF